MIISFRQRYLLSHALNNIWEAPRPRIQKESPLLTSYRSHILPTCTALRSGYLAVTSLRIRGAIMLQIDKTNLLVWKRPSYIHQL